LTLDGKFLGSSSINGGNSFLWLVRLTDVATTPVKYGPIQYALLEESTVPKTPRKAKKSADRHIERSTSFRLGPKVLKAADVIAREESAARGIKVSRADIIRETVMERYRRRKVKRKG
jgi:hypothetical protein